MLCAVALAAGCGGSDRRDDGRLGARAISAPAVELRAELAAALGARPWLVALAARTTLVDGAGAPRARAARRTLDDGSRALAEQLGAALGDRVQARSLTLLRRDDALLAALARTRALRQPAAAKAVRTSLLADRRALAALLATRGRSVRELESELAPAARSLTAAVVAVAAGSPRAPASIAATARRATRPAPGIALAAKRRRPALTGSPTSPAAELSALAAAAFTDHAYAQAATDAVVAAGATKGARLRAAVGTLDETTDALAQFVAAVHGEDAGERFALLWRAHTVAFADYTRAKVNGDPIVAQRALSELARFRRQTATLFDELDPEGSPRGLAAALTVHVDTTTAAIRAQVAKSPKLGPRLLLAADAARGVGRALAIRFARQFPEKLPAG